MRQIVVVIVIVVIDEAELLFHDCRIIAQSYLSSADSAGFADIDEYARAAFTQLGNNLTHAPSEQPAGCTGEQNADDKVQAQCAGAEEET